MTETAEFNPFAYDFHRDPREFERPVALAWYPDQRAELLAFGHGAHMCLVAAVARLEARVALHEFLTQYEGYQVHEDAVELLHAGNVHGPAKVPVTVG